MSFLGSIFHRAKGKSAVLIDISADSVAGAYVHYAEHALPVLIYSHRIPIEMRKSGPEPMEILSALKELGSVLLHDGAPLLVRATGTGSVQNIFVSIDAPWQHTSIRTEHFEKRMPFVFDRHTVQAALEHSSAVPLGYRLVNESIINTTLNGYETRNPYGRKVHRAAVSILTSYVNEAIAKDISMVLKSLYHTRDIGCITSASLRYQALRLVFPHEQSTLIVDALGSFPSIALVRKGSLAEIIQSPQQTPHLSQWLKETTNEFGEVAKQFPLPRTLFLLAKEEEIESLKDALGSADWRTLWLSETPPKIVSVVSSHLSGLIEQAPGSAPDVPLLLMALYFG